MLGVQTCECVDVYFVVQRTAVLWDSCRKPRSALTFSVIHASIQLDFRKLAAFPSVPSVLCASISCSQQCCPAVAQLCAITTTTQRLHLWAAMAAMAMAMAEVASACFQLCPSFSAAVASSTSLFSWCARHPNCSNHAFHLFLTGNTCIYII